MDPLLFSLSFNRVYQMPMCDALVSTKNRDVVPRSVDIRIVSNSETINLVVINMKFDATTIFMAQHYVEGPYHRRLRHVGSGTILGLT